MFVDDTCLWQYRNISFYSDHIISGYNKISGIVIDITDYKNDVIIRMQDKFLVYDKKYNHIYITEFSYCIMYNNDMYTFSQDKHSHSVWFRCQLYDIEQAVESLDDFIRFLRSSRKIEYDPKKVDHGTVIYKRKPGPMIKQSKQLSDIKMILQN